MRIIPFYFLYLELVILHPTISTWQESSTELQVTITLDSKSIYSVFDLSFLLSTCGKDSLRESKKSTEWAIRALELDPKGSYALNARAFASAVGGDFDAAVQWEKKAVADSEYMEDSGIDGGVCAAERIADWEARKLWLTPLPIHMSGFGRRIEFG